MTTLKKKYDLTDLGNAQRFLDQHGADFKYLPEVNRWIHWDGTRWNVRDGLANANDAAIRTIKDLYDSAWSEQDMQRRKGMTDWALRCQSSGRIEAMLSVARKHLQVHASLSEFDTAPDLLNTPNGVVDLRTGELTGHSPDLKLMKRTRVNYVPHAKCDRFIAFLHEIFQDDKELIAYVHRALGYTLTGHTKEHAFFLCLGGGSNGKSTLLEALHYILGDYSQTSEFSAFTAAGVNGVNVRVLEQIGRLRGKRMALASETGSRTAFNEGTIKRITGGDTIQGAELHGGVYSFQPEFKLWLAANHKPTVKDDSEGFWRRIKVIPFMRKFSESERNPDLPAILRSEAEGILAWLVRGARRWYQHGKVGKCAAVAAYTSEYQTEEDHLMQFIEDCVAVDAESSETSADLFAAYSDWCNDNLGVTGESMRWFSMRFSDKVSGIVMKTKTSRGAVWRGVKLRSYGASSEYGSENEAQQ